MFKVYRIEFHLSGHIPDEQNRSVWVMNNGPTDTLAVESEYLETGSERILVFEQEGNTAVIAQNKSGYGMLKIRNGIDGKELERYYGFDMALDHAAELLNRNPSDLPVPGEASDMGM